MYIRAFVISFVRVLVFSSISESDITFTKESVFWVNKIWLSLLLLPRRTTSKNARNSVPATWTKAALMSFRTMLGRRLLQFQEFSRRCILRSLSTSKTSPDNVVVVDRNGNSVVEQTRFRKKPPLGSRYLTEASRTFDFNAWYILSEF